MWALICLTAAAALGVARASIIVYTQDLPHSIAEEFRDLPASFGPELPPDGLRGFLVSGQPESGCGPLAKPPAADNFTGKWIVLVARYNCSFEEKVRNAQLAGYDCVIVHNVNSSDLETMSAKDPQGIVIPSVFVSDVAGIIIAENYNYTNGYYIMVNGDLPFNINTNLLLPFAIVVVLCLLVILTFMIVKCIRDRNRARRHRLPNRSLKKIPTCKFSKGDPYDTCAICLDDYVEGDKLRVLPCAHAYHMKCVDPWLTQNRRVCPVCKRRVMAAGERVPPRAASDTDTDDDTAPLISADTGDVTQGGTFDEQSENPFRRAQRFMLRLHASGATRSALARRLGRGEANREAPPASENDESNNDNDNNDNGGRQAVAAATSVSTHSERTPNSSSRSSGRRARRARRSLSAGAGRGVRADAHVSVNADAQPHIGVAALPASNDLHPPHIINL